MAELYPKHTNAQCFLSLLLNESIEYRMLKFKIEPEYFLDPVDRDIWKAWRHAQDEPELKGSADFVWRHIIATRKLTSQKDISMLLNQIVHISTGPLLGNANFYARRMLIDYLTFELSAAIRNAHLSPDYDSKIRILKEKIEKLESIELDGDKAYWMVIEMLEAHVNDKQALLEQAGDSWVSSGYPHLDDVVRFGRGHLIVIGGRSGMGKTMTALNFVRQMVEAGRKVGVFTLEMTKGEILDMLTAQTGGVSYERLRDPGNMDSDDMDGMMGAMRSFHANGKGLAIADKPGVDLAFIRTTIGDFKSAMGGLDAIMIDHIHLIRERGEIREAMIRISGMLKELAKEFGIPILALSQLNRDCDKRMNHLPMISDLKESSSIEADADAILFTYRPSFYDDNVDPSKLQMWVRKNRHGSKNNVPIHFTGNAETKRLTAG